MDSCYEDSTKYITYFQNKISVLLCNKNHMTNEQLLSGFYKIYHLFQNKISVLLYNVNHMTNEQLFLGFHKIYHLFQNKISVL